MPPIARVCIPGVRDYTPGRGSAWYSIPCSAPALSSAAASDTAFKKRHTSTLERAGPDGSKDPCRATYQTPYRKGLFYGAPGTQSSSPLIDMPTWGQPRRPGGAHPSAPSSSTLLRLLSHRGHPKPPASAIGDICAHRPLPPQIKAVYESPQAADHAHMHEVPVAFMAMGELPLVPTPASSATRTRTS